MVFLFQDGKRSILLLVTKTINNNIVACIGDDGRESIAMGRGLGFDFKAGATLDMKRVEKIFEISEQSGYDSIKNLFSKLPEKQIEVCVGIIDYAKEILSTSLNDSVYLTLTDHVNFAISRFREGMHVGSALTSEVRIFYPREYSVGRYALSAIRKELGVILPEDEACSIALHIVNAEFSSQIGSVVGITGTIRDTLFLIDSRLGVGSSEDDPKSSELISFLKFLVFRVYGESGDTDDGEDMLSNLIEHACPRVKEIADEVAALLFKGSRRKLSGVDRALLEANIYCYEKYIERRR